MDWFHALARYLRHKYSKKHCSTVNLTISSEKYVGKRKMLDIFNRKIVIILLCNVIEMFRHKVRKPLLSIHIRYPNSSNHYFSTKNHHLYITVFMLEFQDHSGKIKIIFSRGTEWRNGSVHSLRLASISLTLQWMWVISHSLQYQESVICRCSRKENWAIIIISSSLNGK